MEITKNSTVGSVVTENIKAAHVFKKHGIDFCCGGGITLEKACSKNDASFETLASDLLAIGQASKDEYDFDKWELDKLIDYIINTHHSYVLENLELLSQYSNKVAKVHGKKFPDLHVINKLYHEVALELVSHMKKEEQILFPYVKTILVTKRNNSKTPEPSFRTVNNPINMMEHEHENAGDVFKTIAILTNDYTPPEGACNTFKALYAKLEEFEQDLHRHIHLENNILHPKAIALEKELNG